jgi:hypothetical protein
MYHYHQHIYSVYVDVQELVLSMIKRVTDKQVDVTGASIVSWKIITIKQYIFASQGDNSVSLTPSSVTLG